MPLTAADIRQIAAESGLDHAEFCIEQAETQEGSLPEARAELAKLVQAAWLDHEASLNDAD